MSREAEALPLHRRLRGGLLWHKKPLISFRKPRIDGAVGARLLRLRLPDLMRSEVEFVLLVQNRLPCDIPADRFIDVLQARPVSGKEHERVSVQPGRRAA